MSGRQLSVRASGLGPSPGRTKLPLLQSYNSTATSATSDVLRTASSSVALKMASSSDRTQASNQEDVELQKSKGCSSNSLNGKVSFGRLLNMSSTLSSKGVKHVEDLTQTADAFGLPSFQLKPFGLEWQKDVAYILTNSVRREVMDLYVILQSMHERQGMLRSGDIESFYVWFITFADFVKFTMELIEDTLIPWVERSSELAEDAYLEGKGGRMKVGKDIAKTVERVVKHQKEFEVMKVGSAFKKLHKVFRKWTPLLHGYLNSLDTDVVDIIEASCNQDECTNMMAWITRQAVESSNKAKNLVLLVRFLEDRPRSLAVWKRDNLEPLERGAHPQHWKNLAKDHFEVVSYFRRATPSLAKGKNQ